MKKKKGFTLVELLAVIVILAIVVSITLIVYNNYTDKSKNTIQKIERNELINSAAAYYNEFGNTKDYLSYDVNNTTYSCVKLQTLIDSGYYDTKVKFSDIEKETAVIKIIKKGNGVVDYSLTDNVDSQCYHDDYSGSVDKYSIKNNNTDVGVSLSLTQSGSAYDYILKMSLDTEKIYSKVENDYPVYVLLILDTSGSMSGTRYTNAVNAAKTLANSLIGNKKIGSKTKIGVVPFASGISGNIRTFQNKNLSSYSFPGATGGTSIGVAFNKASEMIGSINDSNALKFVIFLSDGEPTDSECSGAAKMKNCANKVTSKGAKLIVIGYDMGANNIYQTIASVDNQLCKNSAYSSGGNYYCYYTSDPSKINNLFSELSNRIVTISQSYKAADVYIKFSDAVKLYDSSGNIISNNTVNINNLAFNIDTMVYNYSYRVRIDKDKISSSVSLFNNSKLILTDKNGVKHEINIGNPTLTVTKDLGKAFIN